MDKIYANTDAIQEVAQNIASYNNSIQNQYSIVNTAISKIKNNWSGQAFEIAEKKYRIFHRCYYEGTENTRYSVIDDFVKILNLSIADGYEQTEKLNTKLADAFK